MCDFCGWIKYKDEIEDKNSIMYSMINSEIENMSSQKKYYQMQYINIGGSFDNENNLTIFEKICNGKKYVICYDGQIYNLNELKNEINALGISIETNFEIEIVLASYIMWKEKCVEHFVGVFGFGVWEEDEKKLFLARDRFGVKTIFYAKRDDVYIFGTRIKHILSYPNIKAQIDLDGIRQLFGFGPAKIEGKCIFKDIYELEPASYMLCSYENGKIKNLEKTYWEFSSVKHLDSEKETINKIIELLNNSIKGQLKTNQSFGTMLSGGLDSSIITARAFKECEKNNKKLKTFSVDYVDNDKNFKANDFQPDSDNKYIDMMKAKFDFEHKTILLESDKLIKGLYDVMRARELPGMADVDSSLLEFCKYIKEDVDIVLSGEFADEIFGGYPWFYRDECLNSDTFPWSMSLDIRKNIINKEFRYKLFLDDYVKDIYNNFVKKVPYNGEESLEERNIKKLMYLNIHWFGETLIDRTSKISRLSRLDVRVPFTDYRLAQYVWNIPWKIKTMLEREKGLLRVAYQDELPNEVAFRKKSPYPKTYDPIYTDKLKSVLFDILKDEKAPINKLIDTKEVENIINNLEENFVTPWFGQLMRGPQFIAYLIQLNMWLIEYNVEVIKG